MPQKVLVTGASIAGNSVALLLGRHGFDVVVVECAPEFRDGGQNVDVRGAAKVVVERIGLLQAVADRGTGEAGLRFVDATGKRVADFRLAQLDGNGFTAELEILRGDLARLLYEEARGHAAYRFGDAIASVEENADGVLVGFESGACATFDLVVIAEGVGSSTRDLAFGGENEPRWLDVTMGYFTIPKGNGDGDMSRWLTVPGGRSVFLRPDRKGTTRAVLTIQAPAQGEERLTSVEQKAFLRKRFADAGWETPRVLAGMDAADDFYFDVLRQVKMKRWSKGRVILVGDAAWCATPLSGVGTSLALTGAYILAGELTSGECLQTALSTYERIMRPFVDKGQNFPKFGARMAQPQTALGVHLQRLLLRIAAAPGVRKTVARLMTPKADHVGLRDYPVLRVNP